MAITWPWLVEPTTTTIGPIGGDVSTSISKFGAIVRDGAVPFVSQTVRSVGFPDGVSTTPGLDSASFLSTLYLWGASALMGPVAAHGLFAVLGFSLTATVTYLFIHKVTGSLGAGLVAGVAYGFSPHLYGMSYAATTYTHMWLLLLPIWGFWSLALAPTRRSALLAGGSLVPAMFWTPYYTLHVFVVGTACLAVVALLSSRIGLTRRLMALVIAPWATAVVAYVGIGVLTSFSDAPDRPLTDFYQQAAHPLMFVWPGAGTIWGDGVPEALYRQVPRALNANLYVGLSVLLLGAIGVWTTLSGWVTNRLRQAPSSEGLAALLALAVVVACFICSLPPRVLNGSVPMPSSIIFEAAPGLRAGQRFVMPLMAGTAVLAGLGAAFLLRRVPRRALVPASLALALLVGVDLYTRFPGMIDKVPPRSPALEALATAPDGPVVQINIWGFLGANTQRACLMQEVHGKQLVNPCGFEPREGLRRLTLLDMCDALSRLREDGVRYVLLDPFSAPDNVAACFRGRSPIGSWRLLARDGYIAVIELPPSGS